ncbi:hypothetical protein NDU88_003355 [Pleurodeles waltl]|uniref:Uncharacterized protein n=1 Tax=Pleurodeles waltl TaxID=8319 RepID=A0AAV7RGC5_PLEWA|nr:hypothetical protein NDU88_003355 [Pleurodeles waltl]
MHRGGACAFSIRPWFGVCARWRQSAADAVDASPSLPAAVWYTASCPLESASPQALGTVCMIRTRSSMSKHSPQFCGVLGHTFMEFLKGSGDYCQAQHDLYADK